MPRIKGKTNMISVARALADASNGEVSRKKMAIARKQRSIAESISAIEDHKRYVTDYKATCERLTKEIETTVVKPAEDFLAIVKKVRDKLPVKEIYYDENPNHSSFKKIVVTTDDLKSPRGRPIGIFKMAIDINRRKPVAIVNYSRLGASKYHPYVKFTGQGGSICFGDAGNTKMGKFSQDLNLFSYIEYIINLLVEGDGSGGYITWMDWYRVCEKRPRGYKDHGYFGGASMQKASTGKREFSSGKLAKLGELLELENRDREAYAKKAREEVGTNRMEGMTMSEMVYAEWVDAGMVSTNVTTPPIPPGVTERIPA